MSANNFYKKQIFPTISLAAIALLPLTAITLPASAQNQCQVSQFESQVIDLINRERQQSGLRTLELNCQLVAAAQNHTRDMANTGMLSHRGSDDSSMVDRARRVGYRPRALAENIARGQQTPQEVVAAWMNSAGHRRNILNPRYTETGVGYLDDYWTQVFGRSR